MTAAVCGMLGNVVIISWGDVLYSGWVSPEAIWLLVSLLVVFDLLVDSSQQMLMALDLWLFFITILCYFHASKF